MPFETTKDGEKYQILKPKLIFWIVVLTSMIGSLFISIWSTLFIGGIFLGVASAFFGLKLTFAKFAIFGVGFYVISNVLLIWGSYAKAGKMEYRFFGYKIEYYEGFFTVEKKVIYYDRITNISLRKGIFEKRYNLGSISIATAGTEGNELLISSVENPDKWYDWINKVTKQYKLKPAAQ